MSLVEKAYLASVATMKPGKNGTPACYAPMPWSDLQPEVKLAYERAVELICADNPNCSPGTLAQLAYRGWTSMLPGRHAPFKELAASLQLKWKTFASTVSETYWKSIN